MTLPPDLPPRFAELHTGGMAKPERGGAWIAPAVVGIAATVLLVAVSYALPAAVSWLAGVIDAMKGMMR